MQPEGESVSLQGQMVAPAALEERAPAWESSPARSRSGVPAQWPFVALSGSILGVALQLQQARLWPRLDYIALAATGFLLLVGILVLRRHSRHYSRWRVSAIAPKGRTALSLAIALLIGAALGAGVTGWRAVAFQAQALNPDIEGRDVRVTGIVSSMPQPGPSALRFRFEVEAAAWADGGSSVPTLPPRLSLGWYPRDIDAGAKAEPASGTVQESQGVEVALPALHAGERWRMTLRLKAPHGTLNPYGFDYELRLWEQGLQATGYVRDGAKDAPAERLATTWRHPVEQAREAVRDAIFRHVSDRRAAGVIAALVTGDQSAIERADWDAFRATGVAHLMSISGLHITMFAWLAGIVVGWCWRRVGGSGRAGRSGRSDYAAMPFTLRYPAQRAALLGGVGLALAYAVFSGWGVPSQRTVWMLATVAALRLAGLRWPWPMHWLVACAVVVAIDPWALMQPGFWLSFVAVGILFATNNIAVSARAVSVSGTFLINLRQQFRMTVALAPLTLLLFQQISLVGLAANAVAIPWVTLVVMPLSMAGVLWSPIWTAAQWAVNALSWFLGLLAGLPFATLSLPAPPLWAALAGVAGGVLLTMRLPWTMRVAGLPLLLPVLLWQAPRPGVGEFDLLAADIGQGNAVLVRTAHHSLLYDTGPRFNVDNDAGQRVLVPLLRALGEHIDMLVLSHRDSDHTGGAPAVLATQPDAQLLSSIEESHPLQALRKAGRCEAGQRWQWDGIDFEILHPASDDYAREPKPKPNAISCVLRIGNGRRSALLVGDIEHAQEADIVARAKDVPTSSLGADFLLAPHHGSKTSSSAIFLDAVKPSVAVFQAGYRNRFRHPAPEVLARYRERGIAIVDSPHCGAASWRSSDSPEEPEASAATVCQRDIARRYWHHQVLPLALP